MNLLRKCYDMTDFRIGHSYQHDKLEFEIVKKSAAVYCTLLVYIIS